MNKPLRWVYGVTTVPERRADLLPRTLVSLDRAGFPSPRIFVDGCADAGLYSSHQATLRPPPALGVYGNWIMSAWELYIREPAGSYYALFQDDVLAYRNLRPYLEKTLDPEARRYYNLYAYPDNEILAHGQVGWHPSNGRGLGALGLVFSREALMALLSSTHLARKPACVNRGKTHADGGVVEAMEVEMSQRECGPFKETVHYPTLLYHAGTLSTQTMKFGNPRLWGPRSVAGSWRGEDFDAMELLAQPAGTSEPG